MTPGFRKGSIESWHLLYLQALEERPELTPEEFARRIDESPLRRTVLERLRASERTLGSLADFREEGDLSLPEIPGFRIDRHAGRGGAGSIFHATSRDSEREVAIKMLSLYGATPRRIRRFERESVVLQELDHPNVARYFGGGRIRGALYLVMEWVDGCSLASLLQSLSGIDPASVSRLRFDLILDRISRKASQKAPRSPKPASDARRRGTVASRPTRRNYLDAMIEAGTRLADALASTHAKKIVHRDISPSNIMLRFEDGGPVLVDFGLARRSDADDLTMTGELLGKPHYVAPEYARAMKIGTSRRADVYSLGVVLYQMLTLAPPYDGSATIDILRSAIRRRPRSPRIVNPAIPRGLADLVMWALEKDPAARIPSARAFATELRRLLPERAASPRRSSRAAGGAPRKRQL